MDCQAIIVDSREQKPLWQEDVVVQKLDVGDYTTPQLLGVAHAERKSPQDLYSSLLHGHARFRAELKRAQENSVKLAVFVECSERQFYSKRWAGGWERKAKGSVLARIVSTVQDKYGIPFIWCKDRDDMREQVVLWLENEKRLNNVNNG